MGEQGEAAVPPRYEHMPTRECPYICLDGAAGTLDFSGTSMPENPVPIYAPVLEWIDGYVAHPAAQTLVRFRFTYFNTASSKMVLSVLEHLAVLLEAEHPLRIEWYYEADDEDMQDAGREYGELAEVPIELVEQKAKNE